MEDGVYILASRSKNKAGYNVLSKMFRQRTYTSHPVVHIQNGRTACVIWSVVSLFIYGVSRFMMLNDSNPFEFLS